MFPPIFSDLLSDKEASPNQQHPPFPPSPFASPFPAGTTIRRSLLAASATETRQKNPENSVNSRIVEGREIKIYIGSNAGWIGIRAISFRKRALFFFLSILSKGISLDLRIGGMRGEGIIIISPRRRCIEKSGLDKWSDKIEFVLENMTFYRPRNRIWGISMKRRSWK